MRPVPTMPTVRPWRSNPSKPSSENPFAYSRIRPMDLSVQLEHQRDRVFSHGVRRVGRYTCDRHSRPVCGREIHMIEPGGPERQHPYTACREDFDDRFIELIVDKSAHGFATGGECGCR
jgi:hypothetical protein